MVKNVGAHLDVSFRVVGNTCPGLEVTLCNSCPEGHGPQDMSWDIQDTIGRRHEFVTLALAGSVSMAELCRRFGISRKTGYKWRERFAVNGVLALVDRPQDRSRPRQQTPARTAAKVLALRRRHPTWGPRKLHRR